jgi:adenylosuccinate synthase
MDVLANVQVEYVTFEGWKSSISECRTFDSLPENAKKYIKFIEEFLEVPGNFLSFCHTIFLHFILTQR